MQTGYWQGYGLDAPWFGLGQGGEYFSLPKTERALGLVYCPIRTGCFAGVRRPKRQDYHLPVSSAEVKSCTSPIPSISMASLFSLNCADDLQCIEIEIEGLVPVPILRCDDTACDCVDIALWRHNLWLCRYCAVTTQPRCTIVISLYWVSSL